MLWICINMVLCHRKHNLSSTNFLPCCTPLTFLTEDTNRYPFGPTHSAVQPLPQSRVYCTPHNTCTTSTYCSKCTNKYITWKLSIVDVKKTNSWFWWWPKEKKRWTMELYLFSIYKNVKNKQIGEIKFHQCPCVWTNMKGT